MIRDATKRHTATLKEVTSLPVWDWSVCACYNNLTSFTQSWPVWQGGKKEAFSEKTPQSHLCFKKNTPERF